MRIKIRVFSLKISIKSVFFNKYDHSHHLPKKGPRSLLFYMHSLITPYKVHYIGVISLLVLENLVRINMTCIVDEKNTNSVL